MVSFEWKLLNHAPKLHWCLPCDQVTRSSYVNRFRAIGRLLSLLLPARPTCACGFDAALPPTTTAPTGSPARKPGTPAAGVPGVGSPVKKYPAREKPNRAVFTSVGENT